MWNLDFPPCRSLRRALQYLNTSSYSCSVKEWNWEISKFPISQPAMLEYIELLDASNKILAKHLLPGIGGGLPLAPWWQSLQSSNDLRPQRMSSGNRVGSLIPPLESLPSDEEDAQSHQSQSSDGNGNQDVEVSVYFTVFVSRPPQEGCNCQDFKLRILRRRGQSWGLKIGPRSVGWFKENRAQTWWSYYYAADYWWLNTIMRKRLSCGWKSAWYKHCLQEL